MKKYLLKNALIITGEKQELGDIHIVNGKIDKIRYYNEEKDSKLETTLDSSSTIIDLNGKCLMAGGIDAHVHFREPGMTHKANIHSESQMALIGGITSFMDMPNTVPPTTSIDRIEEKLNIGEKTSYINYGFNIGATNTNVDEIEQLIESGEAEKFGAIKVFMGSSTGNMLVDDKSALHKLFKIKGKYIFIHSEDEETIKRNLALATEKYGENIPFEEHPKIRSHKACILSTARALEAAVKYNTRLHILHVSTAEEVEMIRAAKIHNPYISAETSTNYLWFSDLQYPTMKGKIKCNPAIKGEKDRLALIEGIRNGIIDTIGSDHAPHQWIEKNKPYKSCPSGLPSIGQSFPAMLYLAKKYDISLNRVTQLMSEKISDMLGIEKRGRIKEGYYADLIVFNPEKEYKIEGNAGYFCNWSPYEGETLCGKPEMVFLNGELVLDNGKIIQDHKAKALKFNIFKD